MKYNKFKTDNYPLNQNFVCFDCRKHSKVCLINSRPYKSCSTCSECNKDMHYVGKNFKTPKRKNIKKWYELKHTWKVFHNRNYELTINVPTKYY